MDPQIFWGFYRLKCKVCRQLFNLHLLAGDLQKWMSGIELVWQLTVCGKSFFLSANWENANTGKSHSSSVQSHPTYEVFCLWKEFHGYKWYNCMLKYVWRRKFVKPESDTCDQHPLRTLKLHELCDSVTEPSLPISVRFIYYFIFEGTVCNLHLPTTIRKHVQHVCAKD